MADEANRSIVPVLLQVAFPGKCDDQGLDPRGWPFACLSDFVADCHDSGDYVLSGRTSPAGMLSTPAHSLSSVIVLQLPLLCDGWGGLLFL